MVYMFAKGQLAYFVNVAAARGLRFALRHGRLCKKVYVPWVRAKIFASGLFDREFYVKNYVRGPLVIDPFQHYFQRGRFYHLRPNKDFNSVAYRLFVMPSGSRLLPPLHYALHKPNIGGMPDKYADVEKDHFSARFWDILELCRVYRITLTTKTPILDFGCGEGATVAELADANYNAFGFDIVPRLTGKAQAYPERFFFNETGVKKTGTSPNIVDYRLEKPDISIPFSDNFFGLILSFQVMEHVFNMEQTLREISRVLRRGAYAFHIFPLKSCFLERHSNIPLGHRLHYQWYCNFWAALGMAGRKKDRPWREIAIREYDYIGKALNYHTSSQIMNLARPYYSQVEIVPWPMYYTLNPFFELWKKFFPPNILLVCKK